MKKLDQLLCTKMCEQTEINYLDGDVVWVKLGACWWPGQVTGLHNLPEDIQAEFQKKPLIAAVKFFQEDTYEFVKNYQQIYKYNCTLKDDFIKKGLDKYRSKSKDGANYMDKFPGDVETAEKLTGGDPNILRQEKFCPEEKPDISALFGEKKIPKKRRDREDGHRRSDGSDLIKKITHPRFTRGESDHEIRIRQQPGSLPSTPTNMGSPVYRCHICSFTSSRVNVIICHIKSHRSNESPSPQSKTYSRSHSRISDVSTPKRKYMKKEKSQSSRKKSESGEESSKRKSQKQGEKSSKKKKIDPKLKEKLLADWDDEELDEDTNGDVNTSSLNSSLNSSVKNISSADESKEYNEEDNKADTNEIMTETEKFLKETEELSIKKIKDSLDYLHTSKNTRLDRKFEAEHKHFEKGTSSNVSNETKKSPKKDASSSDSENRNASDKDDKKSRLSCFDFDEDDLSEPSIQPVRKIPRVFGEKSLSLKKEIIKEFEMSQALKNEIKKNAEKMSELDKSMDLKAHEIIEIIQGTDTHQEKKETKANEELDEIVQDKTEVKQPEDKKRDKKQELTQSENDQQKSSTCETEVEIVEIFEVEREDADIGDNTSLTKDTEKEVTSSPSVSVKSDKTTKNKDKIFMDIKSGNKLLQSTKTDSEENVIGESNDASTKETEDTMSERCTTETEDETVSESAETVVEQSENSDIDMLDRSNNSKLSENRAGQTLKKRGRGRPRKNARSTSRDTTVEKSPKVNRGNKRFRMSERFELERKTSDSDTDRSYSGRRRKPNKKYLESDIYVSDPDYKALRTDESQSESETKEKIVSKPRRGRRPKGVDTKSSSELVVQMDKQEIEVSYQTDSQNNVSSIDIKQGASESNVSKKLMFSEEKISEETKHDILEESVKSPNKAATRADVNTFSEVTTMLEPNKDVELNLNKTIEEKVNEKDKEDTLKQDNNKEDDINQEKSSIKAQTEDTASKIETSRDTTKINVDMLPPKKSQIKKFELSQIELLDTDVQTTQAIETKPEPESKIDPEPKIEAEPERQVVPEPVLQPEVENDVKEKINIENQSEIKTVIKTTDEIINSSKTETKLQDTVESVELKETLEKSVEEKQEIQSVKETSKKAQDVNQSEIKSPAKSSSTKPKADDAKNVPKSPSKTTTEQVIPKKSSMQTRYKGRFTPETGKGRKDLFSEEKPSNTFQEAFLKTLEMDKKTLAGNTETSKGRREKRAAKKKAEETDTNVTAPPAKSTKLDESSKDLEVRETIQPAEENILLEGNIQGNTSDLSIDMSNIENTEVVVEENVEIDTKIGDNVLTIDQLGGSSSSEFVIAPNKSSLELSTPSEDNAKNDDKKLDKIPQTSVPISSLSSDISMPVKKREMPRIIENVTLTEPVQILKTKLLDKTPQKGVKHKLEMDVSKKSASKAKVMKIDTSSSNSKVKTVKSSVTSSQLPITKKLQVLKTEEVETLLDAQNKEQNTTPTTIVTTSVSSQNLVDMEFDINSMPFVLSDDMLTPEQIEQMPVVISSIIPASSSIPSTLSLTPTTQIVSPTQTQFKIVNETPTTEPSPSPSPKKKSGMPAILKSKSKAKPTITSVKTIVPPLTGGVKGLKFQSAQPISKTTPVLAQKSPAPGKYVLVQTASGQQQLRQVVQSKSSTSQKVILPPNISKTITSGAQLIQQGGKVVILTSGQSQAKMVPVNISKTLSGKMQKIVTSKGQQLLCPISPQGSIITSKTPKVIAPKGDAAAATAGSPTTSKLVSGQKIISTTFTPISGTVTKLGTLSQGILTKGGVYTPITAISGKTIISSKALVTKGGTTLLSAQGQSLGGTKTILTPVSQAITGKTILGTPTIVSSKGTILTPISGQQMKTIVTKSPTKSGKVQYQQVQHKVQILQKSPKATTTAGGSQGRTSAKLSGSTLILQTASPAAGAQKSTPQSKKIVKQTMQPAIQNIASPSSAQPTVTIMQQVQPKGKTATAQKVIIPRTGRQTKAQQKMAAQKAQESMSTVQNILPKTVVATSTNMSTPTKTIAQSKQAAPTIPKSPAKSQTPSKAQKNLMNVPMNSMSTITTANIATTVPLPPLEPIDADKKAKTNIQSVDSAQKKPTDKFQPEKSADAEKMEEAKVVTQPQIMALPTESSDGTQTYVLVTIDEQGQIQPLDNNALMSLEGTTQNPDGTRTLYIDPSSLGETGTLDNIVLQFDNGILPNIQTNVTEASQTAIITESFPASEVIQTSNQDILAAALANTDFQQEISLSESQTGSVMTQTGLTQTSLINQTILQSTIIPPTEPISSPSVLETSLTLNQPIMTPLEVPSNVSIQSKETASTSVVSTIPSSLELPITITNPNISYISAAGETQIQIPGNSMPDIGEIIEDPTATTTGEVAERTEIPVSTQYLVIPNLEETQNVQGTEIAITPSASYTVTMSNNIVLESPQVQTTPSMPIIDDAYTDNSQFGTTIVTDQAFVDVPVSEMLVSKAPAENVQSQDVTVTSEMISSHEVPSSPQKSIISTNEAKNLDKEQTTTMQQVFSSQEVPITSEELILQQPAKESSASSTMEVVRESEGDTKESNTPMTSLPIIDESTLVRSESNSMEQVNFDVTDSSELKTAELHEADAMDKLKQLTFSEESDNKAKQQVGTSNQIDVQATSQILALNPSSDATMEVDETIDEPSSQEESDRRRLRQSMELHFADEEEATNTETSQEVPSQSQYEQFNVPVSNDSVDLPSQSANKLESSSGEATQSITYEPMEVDEEAVVTEPPTQSFEHSKNEASQSYEASVETNINAPTQSFNEIAQSEVERPCADEAIDDQSFPTQSYEVDKSENMTENLETDAEISQEGNIPSQSNDIGADGIGTSSVSTNNSGLNEDETASSSYVPETPENQERDQDQESAISTSSYEIPPCEELNIASSSVIPDTSVSTEHTSIRDNGVPEIPTSSSYNLNPDITSTHHVDSVPTSSYEDQVIVEQNVSTSYEVPISMPGLDETCSQNFVPESTDHHRNEPSSYYAHHQEVTESYYESVDQDTNSRLEEDPHEEHVTPGGYYEGNPQEVSQSYFTPAEETTNYSNQGISPGYYDPNRPESEASQSYYSTDDLDGKTEQSSSSPNIEASQSFYQERSGELRLRQQGEATPTYSEGYPADYTLENSPIERHDLVESSVPATRSMDR